MTNQETPLGVDDKHWLERVAGPVVIRLPQSAVIPEDTRATLAQVVGTWFGIAVDPAIMVSQRYGYIREAAMTDEERTTHEHVEQVFAMPKAVVSRLPDCIETREAARLLDVAADLAHRTVERVEAEAARSTA